MPGSALVSFEAHVRKLVRTEGGVLELVTRSWKLFQCLNSLVHLGMSATSSHSYEVCVNNCSLVVCSKTWQAQRD